MLENFQCNLEVIRYSKSYISAVFQLFRYTEEL